MTAHELARELLAGPDLMVVIFQQNDTYYTTLLEIDQDYAWQLHNGDLRTLDWPGHSAKLPVVRIT